MTSSTSIVLIPAYEPKKKILKLIEELRQKTDFQILVVDDGSGEAYAPIFSEAERMGCRVLTHTKNRGKGAALKTGFAWIKKHAWENTVIVTADCDGQHTVRDIARTAWNVKPGGHEIILGSRTFEGDVPGRSRVGNTISRKIFTLFTGLKIWDTQTGLRGFPATALDWLIAIPGDRFEYEQNMLFDGKRMGYTFREIPIETIYENDNKGTHFHPVRDSLLVAMCFLRFSAVSLTCAVLDFTLLGVFFNLTKNLLFAVIITRIITAGLQYTANHFLVFREKKEGMARSSVRYVALAGTMLFLNYLALSLFTGVFRIPLFWAKLLTETLLFLLSYGVQKNFVFTGEYRYNE